MVSFYTTYVFGTIVRLLFVYFGVPGVACFLRGCARIFGVPGVSERVCGGIVIFFSFREVVIVFTSL